MSNLSPYMNKGLFDELFRDVSPGYFIKPLHGDALPSHIKLEVKENPGQFIVHAEIPGAGKENIHVDIQGKNVTIIAQINQTDSESKEDKILRSERYYGEVTRSFQLSTEIDETASKAQYKHGVLTLTLVKKQKKGGQRLVID